MPSRCPTKSPKIRRKSIPKTDFIRQIAHDLPSEFLYPEEAAGILFGRLETARRAVKKAQLRLFMAKCRLYSAPGPLNNKASKEPPSPLHIISRLNRSKTYPWMVPMMPAPGATLSQCCDLGLAYHRLGLPASWILDLICGNGFSTGTLLFEKITSQKVNETDVALVKQARKFWILFGEGRARYVAFLKREKLEPWRGDFAYFDRGQFESLLPGCILADHYQRREYLLNYKAEGHGFVDLYTTSGRALCRHLFDPECRLLSFS